MFGTTDQRPFSDSPWFWFLLFAVMGCVGLAAAMPKYARRQTEIENEYRARDPRFEEVRREDTNSGNSPADTPEERIVPLLPLLVLFAGAAGVSGAMLWREWRMGHSKGDRP
jgi:hypothetical protein